MSHILRHLNKCRNCFHGNPSHLLYNWGPGGDPAWPGGGSGREPHTPQEGLAPGEDAWALGEKQLTSRPGKGAPSGLGWEARAASSGRSSPLHCYKTGRRQREGQETHSPSRGHRTRPPGETPHRFRFNEKWWEEGVLSFYLFTYLLTNLLATKRHTQHAEPRAHRWLWFLPKPCTQTEALGSPNLGEGLPVCLSGLGHCPGLPRLRGGATWRLLPGELLLH